MKAVVFHATREGHTRHIAEHVATNLRAHHVDVNLSDVKTPRVPIDWSFYDRACVAASGPFRPS
jgi:menaquinone-dependent protoporphyrinogen IX oxidase